MTDVIYLDAAASTPIAPEAFEVMVEVLREVGNPGAAHAAGHAAGARVEAAREAVAQLLHVGPAGVVFVGSATEANNLALRGLQWTGERGQTVTTATEHPSVLATLADLPGEAHVVPVTSSGELDLTALEEILSPQIGLVSVHAANNETGVVQPIDKVASLAHSVGAMVHADASQLMAWGENSLLDDCDLVTVSSHKMHGPQGAAALIVRPSARDRLRPQITGGGQERGLRSGTANVAAIAGFGAAAELSFASGHVAASEVSQLRSMLLNGLKVSIGDVIEHGASATCRLPGILNLAVGTGWSDSAESEALLGRLPELAASTGSACHSGAPGPSPVLLAMGIPEWNAARSVRLSLSRYSTRADVHRAVVELGRGFAELQRLLGESNTNERHAL